MMAFFEFDTGQFVSYKHDSKTPSDAQFIALSFLWTEGSTGRLDLL